MKYWIDRESRGDNLIVISDTVIYCSNYSDNKLREFELELLSGLIPKALTGTPFGYIKYIEASSKKDRLMIYFGKENELKLVVKNEMIRKEIFEYLKEDKTNLPSYQKEHLSRLKASRKPLIVLLVVLGILYYIAGIASDMEGGIEYEVSGGRAGGQAIGNLIIGLAQMLGTKGVLLFGAIPLLIILYKLVKNIQSPPIIETLHYKKK